LEIWRRLIGNVADQGRPAAKERVLQSATAAKIAQHDVEAETRQTEKEINVTGKVLTASSQSAESQGVETPVKEVWPTEVCTAAEPDSEVTAEAKPDEPLDDPGIPGLPWHLCNLPPDDKDVWQKCCTGIDMYSPRAVMSLEESKVCTFGSTLATIPRLNRSVEG
jgi:hypothetical protein